MIFKYFNKLSPFKKNKTLIKHKTADQNTINTRTSLFILNQSLQNNNHGENSLSYVALTIWNKLPDCLKTTKNVNKSKHNEV